MEEITKQSVLDKAKLCNTKGEFSRRFSRFFNYAKQYNFLHEFYDDLRDTNTKYTLEILQKEALKYHTRYQFKLEAGNVYEAARRLGHLNKICEHMIPARIGFGQRICEQLFNQILNIKGIYNDRSTIHPLELDIYYPDYKLAIEFQGVNWHSHDRAIHNDAKKIDICEDKNITLLHFHESDKSHDDQISSIKTQIIKFIPLLNEKFKLNLKNEYINFLTVDKNKIYNLASMNHFKNVIATYNCLKDFSLLEPGIYDAIRKINRMDLLEHFRERRYPYKWRNMTDDEILVYIKDKFPTGILGRGASTYVTILKRRKLTEKFKSLFK